MDEFQFINFIKQKTYKQKSLLKGIGDDAAVFRSTGSDVVTAVDTFVEGIHFSFKTMKPYHIGYRALAANISDIAAMGAEPKFYLVSIVIPQNMTAETLKQLYSGMYDLANKYQVDLIGGDTVTGEQLTISITIIGYVPTDKARYRHTAELNDIVFVTGTLGDSQAGLYTLLNGKENENTENFIYKHRMPSPRVKFSTLLQPLERVALNDISDGIANELREIAEASGVNIVIEDKEIPVSKNFSQFTSSQQFNWKYFGGEDFELVGTAPERDWEFIQNVAKKSSLRVTKIGKVTYNKDRALDGQVFIKKDNHILPLDKKGYIHEVGE